MQSTHALTAMQALLASPPVPTRLTTPARRPRVTGPGPPRPQPTSPRITAPAARRRPLPSATPRRPQPPTPGSQVEYNAYSFHQRITCQLRTSPPRSPATAEVSRSASPPPPSLPAPRAMQSTHARRAWRAPPPSSRRLQPRPTSTHKAEPPAFPASQPTRTRSPRYPQVATPIHPPASPDPPGCRRSLRSRCVRTSPTHHLIKPHLATHVPSDRYRVAPPPPRCLPPPSATPQPTPAPTPDSEVNDKTYSVQQRTSSAVRMPPSASPATAGASTERSLPPPSPASSVFTADIPNPCRSLQPLPPGSPIKHISYSLKQRMIGRSRTPIAPMPNHTQGGHHRIAPTAIPEPGPPRAQLTSARTSSLAPRRQPPPPSRPPRPPQPPTPDSHVDQMSYSLHLRIT